MMYHGESAAKSASGYATAPALNDPAAQPLTLAIIQQQAIGLETAGRVHGQLYELRNRLFGEALTKGGMAGTPAKPIASFSDAVRDKGSELSSLLAEIEYLTNELTNRL